MTTAATASPAVVKSVEKMFLIEKVTFLTELIPPHLPHFSLIMCSPLSPPLKSVLRVKHYTQAASRTWPHFLQLTCRFTVYVQAKHLVCPLGTPVNHGSWIQWCIQPFSLHGKWTVHNNVSSIFRWKQLLTQREHVEGKSHPSLRDR